MNRSHIESLHETGNRDRSAHLRYAGMVGCVGYPLFYVIYVTILHQPYENLAIRLIATLGCLGLALQRRWPEPCKPYYASYSYAVLLYCLPFFHVFMALKNHGGMVMIADSFMAVFFIVLLTDWRDTLTMVFLGVAAGVLVYIATTSSPSVPRDYVERLPTYILVIVGGSLFKFSQKQMSTKLEAEKLQGMSTAVATIAHEIRTPISSINASARGLQRYLPVLIDFYRKNHELAAAGQSISEKHLDMTASVIERISEECRYMNSVIDMLLANAVDEPKRQAIERVAIVPVIERTLALFPYESASARILMKTDLQCSFWIDGGEDQFRMVLMNLIKNAYKAISRANKGTILISTAASEQGGGAVLKVRDTACGIPASQLPRIFERFHTWPPSQGTGIGLTFCRETLQSWGAQITCETEEGVFTEFTIYFPHAVVDESNAHSGDGNIVLPIPFPERQQHQLRNVN